MDQFRIEKDSMGELSIPQDAYYGAQTQRAVENFKISGRPMPELFIHALGLIKKNAALANGTLGTVDPQLSATIAKAAQEVVEGTLNRHFPVDVYQTGSGTSSNMNANEVISNRANEMLGQPLGTRNPVHPNDHVNRGQSSNDVVPSAVQISSRLALLPLVEALKQLITSMEAKAKEFSSILKLGRTHLQDAVPMTLGQEFDTFAAQLKDNLSQIQGTFPYLEELPLGGTAIGTGLNAHPEFAAKAVAGIAADTKIPFKPAVNKFKLIAARDPQVFLMGALNSLATVLMKIGNDLRLLSSGPRGALGEIYLPSLQPGSSIMPGKVNPVIAEMLIQVAARVNGAAVTVTIAGQNAPLQLNMMNPLVASEVIEVSKLLANACSTLATKAIDGITADQKRCRYWIDWSLALVTPLAIRIGYDKASELAYAAFKSGRPIKEVVLEAGIMEEAELDKVLDPQSMV